MRKNPKTRKNGGCKSKPQSRLTPALRLFPLFRVREQRLPAMVFSFLNIFMRQPSAKMDVVDSPVALHCTA